MQGILKIGGGRDTETLGIHVMHRILGGLWGLLIKNYLDYFEK